MIKATKYEVESQILKRIENSLAKHQVDQPDLNTIKTEMYEYI